MSTKLLCRGIVILSGNPRRISGPKERSFGPEILRECAQDDDGRRELSHISRSTVALATIPAMIRGMKWASALWVICLLGGCTYANKPLNSANLSLEARVKNRTRAALGAS